MAVTTVTEALAELGTIEKRLNKKKEFVLSYISRPEGLKDPLVKDGGSFEALKSSRQAIKDLGDRVVRIRTAIQASNMKTTITIGDVTKTVSEWLAWRKEVAPEQQSFLMSLNTKVQQARNAAAQRQASVVTEGKTASKDTDVHINVDEGELAKEAEFLEEVLGTLDGQLSLRNATVQIDV